LGDGDASWSGLGDGDASRSGLDGDASCSGLGDGDRLWLPPSDCKTLLSFLILVTQIIKQKRYLCKFDTAYPFNAFDEALGLGDGELLRLGTLMSAALPFFKDISYRKSSSNEY
jgi:hypothetical protein